MLLQYLINTTYSPRQLLMNFLPVGCPSLMHSLYVSNGCERKVDRLGIFACIEAVKFRSVRRTSVAVFEELTEAFIIEFD
jgi:hypothetical protein